MKPLFITIDTEGDSLWSNPANNEIKTENVLWIPRFQELCEKYSFVPIWLTDYEIASDDRFVDYMYQKNKDGKCEIGIHLHARNNPPIIKLNNEKKDAAAYLIEYPPLVMREKFRLLKSLLEDKFHAPIVTHRAGRWALNQEYIDVLAEQEILYDCSITPGINWSFSPGITPGSHGSDYSNSSSLRHELHSSSGRKITEYPVSIIKRDKYILADNINIKNIIRPFYYSLKKERIWLRPAAYGNYREMKYVLDSIIEEDMPYAEFMIHSSELMPGGSPSFPDIASIDKLYKNLEKVFKYARNIGYVGYTFYTWEKLNSRQTEE
ncbi:deacetylase [Claveliimonas bilis]|uniref:hypothetical protein n=1 Tax=Claveliimonas bilis TaxID=3028070 RepID=UPI00292E6537|nr:hypothetical protein [Claveliimonas bilis]BDZ84431.1 deacetylase [Claveliimonas bilis]